MLREASLGYDSKVRCTDCEAACCRLEVLLITDTGVPERFIETDEWGGMSMARLEDGWCAALDRSSNRCRIYAQRPWICREFQMGGPECIAERAANPLIRAEALFPRSKG
jgi:Fe-S-cluster containining protein